MGIFYRWERRGEGFTWQMENLESRRKKNVRVVICRLASYHYLAFARQTSLFSATSWLKQRQILPFYFSAAKNKKRENVALKIWWKQNWLIIHLVVCNIAISARWLEINIRVKLKSGYKPWMTGEDRQSCEIQCWSLRDSDMDHKN